MRATGRTLWALVALAVLATGVTHASSSRRVPQRLREQARSTGQVRVLVGLKSASPDAVLSALPAGSHAGDHAFASIPFLAMEVTPEALDALETMDGVDLVEEDELFRPLLEYTTHIVGAVDAWAQGYTGAGWSVAILDTGVDKSHPFLAGKVVSQACFSFKGSCPNGNNHQSSGGGGPCEYAPLTCSHGTHVAGIAAGSGPTFSGVAKDATIISVQIFSMFTGSDCYGAGENPCAYTSTSDIIKALEHVYSLRTKLKIAAVNLSVGGRAYVSAVDCDVNNVALKAAVDLLRSAGIATVAASGNESFIDRIDAPACISSAVSVGATDRSDGRLLFSNTASFLSLLAPGWLVNSSIPGGGFTLASGTSMAAPHVTGAWAIRRQASPQASVGDILDAFVHAGKPILDVRIGMSKPRLDIVPSLVFCSAAADPVSGNPPLSVDFTSTVTGGTAPYTSAWDYGDGTPSEAGATIGHVFDLPGLYDVKVTGRDGRGVPCSATTRVLVNGPRITGLRWVPDSSKLVVTGASFERGAVVSIDGAPAPATLFKNQTRLVAAKGAALSAMVPPRIPVRVTVTNPDGVTSAEYEFTRP